MRENWLEACPVCNHANTLSNIPNSITAPLRFERTSRSNDTNISQSSVLNVLFLPFKLIYILLLGVLWLLGGVLIAHLSPIVGILIGGIAGALLGAAAEFLLDEVEGFAGVGLVIGAGFGGLISLFKISKKIGRERNKINRVFFSIGVFLGTFMFIVSLINLLSAHLNVDFS